jgi:hypothetical protein
MTKLHFSSPDPHSLSSHSSQDEKTLLHEVVSAQFSSIEKSIVTSLYSALTSLENRLKEQFMSHLTDKQTGNETFQREISAKLADKAAELLLTKLEESTIGNNLVKEIKRSILIQNKMFQVKTQYIRDDLSDLDNKLGEQMSSIQIDHLRNHDKIVRSITDLSCTVKENTAKQTALYEEIRGHIGVIAGAVGTIVRGKSGPYQAGYPPEPTGQTQKPKVPRGQPGPLSARCEPLSSEEQEEMPPEVQGGGNSGQPPVPPEAPSTPFVPENQVPEQKGSMENSIEEGHP